MIDAPVPTACPKPTIRRSRWRSLVTASVGAAALVLPLVAAPAVAAPTDPTPDGVGVPSGAPDAALRDEPALPAPAAWNFSEAFPRTSGTDRVDSGAYLWTDWLYDDTGTGAFTYADHASTGSNGADIFRAAISSDGDATHWRIDWNTLIDPDVPIAAWTFDTDGDPSTGTAQWPASAGATSAGMETALIVSSRGARLIDLVTGEEIDVVQAGGALTVDAQSRSFIASVPTDLLATDGAWTVRLAAGVADEAGTGFAAAPQSGNGTRVYNAAFRTVDDEPHLVGNSAGTRTEWNNGRQSERLAAGDMSPFAIDLDWAQLASGTSTPEQLPTGYSTRWYVSSADLGQGMTEGARRSPGPGLLPATYLGRVQPYTVYVPTGYSPDEPAPLTLLFHGGDANHNGFLGSRKDDLYGPMCEDRGSICVSPLGRGMSTWYINHGELDIWEVWGRVADTYALDSEATVIGGFSMGGVGVTRLVTNYPDLFAGAVVASGAGYYSTPGIRDREGAPLRVENLAGVPTFFMSGSNDIALGNTQRWDGVLEDSGVPYRAHYYDGGDHGSFLWLGWSDAADYFADAVRTVDPAHVVYRWEPEDDRADLGIVIDGAYWLSDLAPRDTTLRWSRAEAVSHALETAQFDPVHTDVVESIDGRAVQVREQRLVAAGEVTPQNTLELSAQNVATVSIDLDAAAIDPAASGSVDLTSDGPVAVALTRAGERAEIGVEAGETTLASPQAPTSARAVEKRGVATVTWPAAVSALPVTYTVRDAAGSAVCETTATSCAAGNLTPGQPATFTVSARNIVGTSEAATSNAVVVKQGSSTSVSMNRYLGTSSQDYTATVRVRTDSGVGAEGTVTLHVDGKRVTAQLSDGKATVKLGKQKRGIHLVLAEYSGSETTTPSLGLSGFVVLW